MDIVFIRALRIDTVIGIYDWERQIRQTVVLDLEMGTDIARAAATDHIDDTLDYKAVSKRLIQFVSESSFQLVETLAEECARIVREEFGVPWVRLTLNKKGAVRGAEGVGSSSSAARGKGMDQGLASGESDATDFRLCSVSAAA